MLLLIPSAATEERTAMTKIPFIHATFAGKESDHSDAVARLHQFLINLRSDMTLRYEMDMLDTPASLAITEYFDAEALNKARESARESIGRAQREKIQRRVRKLLDRRAETCGLSHLKKDDRDRLEVFRDGVKLVQVASEARADEIAAGLHAEMPWFAPVTERVWHEMRTSARNGEAGLRLRPLLLDGPPGIGKSHFARRLGEMIGAPSTVIEATSENASFGVVGGQRGWGAAYHGRLLQTIMTHRVANPVIVIDEIDKAGRATSTGGGTFVLSEALLPLLERLSASDWPCPYFQVKFDMSWVIWVLTSNNARLLPEPLRSRCPPIQLEPLKAIELIGFARQQGKKRGFPEDCIELIVEVLLSAGKDAERLSLRSVLRLLDDLEDRMERPSLH